jgi:GTP-binding protein
MFVDECRLNVAAGRGGDGAVSFHKEKYQPRGGADGGDGGRGGSVVLVAGQGVGSLGWIRDHPHQKATDGAPGRRNNCTGREGEDLTLPVPPGTIVRDEDGRILADLAAPGDRFVVAPGGRGGRGNAAFVSDARRVAGFGELGEPGASSRVHLELRLIADVTVIGLPNAGKSTLVGALSAAAPKVAAYPFTTLEPTLGRVQVASEDDEVFTICDIPGMIEGAHEGRGLGLGFLRHAERALAFLHLVDVSAGEADPPSDPLEDLRLIRREIAAYNPALAGRPEVVALNKTDLVDDETRDAVVARFRAAGIDPLVISAAEGIGLEGLVARLGEVVAEERRADAARGGFELFRTEQRPLSVAREDGCAWRVCGGAVERWVSMCDLGNPEAVAHLQQRMERAGVERALSAAGATEGDEVRIGPSTFEWFPTTEHGRSTRAPRPTGDRR